MKLDELGRKNLLAPSLAVILGSGLAAFFFLGRVWYSATIESAGMPDAELEVTGTAAYPLTTALSLVLAAAALAILASGPRTRRVIGGFTVLVAAGCLVTVAFTSAEAAQLRAAEESVTYNGENFPESWSVAWWWFPTVGLWLAALIVGLMVARYGQHWPTMGRKYEAPTRETEVADDDLWKAFDEGRDPTQ